MFSFWKDAEGGTRGGKAKLWLILLGAAVGAALLLFGDKVTEKEVDSAPSVYKPQEDELVLYQEYLEERIAALCHSVPGVEHVTAVVTLASGFESVYATEISDTGEEYVIIGSGANAQALFLSRSAPDIAGIGVVCRGADNAVIRAELLSLLSAAFDVPTNRIHITQSGG